MEIILQETANEFCTICIYVELIFWSVNSKHMHYLLISKNALFEPLDSKFLLIVSEPNFRINCFLMPVWLF